MTLKNCWVLVALLALHGCGERSDTARQESESAPALESGQFDRAAAAARIQSRLAQRREYWVQMDETSRRGSAGENVDAARKAPGEIPKMDDLLPDARRVLEVNPADDAAFQAIQTILLANQMTAENEHDEDIRSTHTQMSQQLLAHHLGRADFVEAADLLFLQQDEDLAFWQEVFARSAVPETRGNAAIRFSRYGLALADSGTLTDEQAATLRARAMDALASVQKQYGRYDYQETSLFPIGPSTLKTLEQQAGQLRSERAYAVGATLPDMRATTIDGKPDQLTNYRGRIVLLDFWATWCEPCKEAHPGLIELKRATAGRPFEIIGISVDESVDDVHQYIAEHQPLPWVNWHIESDAPLLEEWGVRGYPTYLLLDENGVVLSRPMRFDESVSTMIRRRVEGLERAKAKS